MFASTMLVSHGRILFCAVHSLLIGDDKYMCKRAWLHETSMQCTVIIQPDNSYIEQKRQYLMVGAIQLTL